MRPDFEIEGAASVAEDSALPWLHGFWNEDHNIPSRPVLVHGDPVRFAADKKAARQRSLDRLDHYAGRALRWMPITTWDRWDFHPEIWE